MQKNERILREFDYYFVVKHHLSDGRSQVTLASSAPFAEGKIILPFDTEEDAALTFLEQMRQGAVVSSNDVAIAQAILDEKRPLFLYEEKQTDGRLFLSLHDHLPPEETQVVVFGSRAPQLVARLLLRRLHESTHVWATKETIRQAHTLLD